MDGRTIAPTGDLLRVAGLTVEFLTDRGWATVVDDVGFGVGRGEIVGLVGESGSGKTVTSKAIMGLIPHPPGRVAGGTVTLDGRRLTGLSPRELEDVRGNDLAMIFQEPMASLNPAYSVGDQIAETVRRHRGVTRRAARNAAEQALDRVGIPGAARRARSYPHEFSGGMRQRVVIAMALCCDPKLVIADEPTTALDVTIQAQVLDLIRHMRDEAGLAILLITHDLGVVADVCDRVVVLYAGQVVEQAPVHDLFRNPTHPYTDALLRSMPQMTARTGELHTIPGQPPFADTLPGGCRFHPRCTHAEERCRHGELPLAATGRLQVSRCVRADDLYPGSEDHRG
jgi:peptide/nickel transport system ATP-binding protein